MDTARSTGGLFWKLMATLCLSMLASLVSTAVYFHLTIPRGALPPMPRVFGLVPIEPLVSGGVAVVVTGVLIAWYLGHPIAHLSWAVREVSHGRFDTRVGPLMKGRRDEIADLASDFDAMAAQLQRLTESRRVLLHDISHELRSPLSRMQAAIGLARQAPAMADEMLARIEREADRLDRLIGELLTLYRLESRDSPVAERSRVDLVELLQGIVDDADFEARQAGTRVTFDAVDAFVTEVDAELICRAFENVVRNAVKYTAAGTVVAVRAQPVNDGQGLVVTVQDRGPGVPPHLLRRIFEPFVRVEGSEHTRGTGLGLAISRRAVALHGGRIEARSRAGGGLEVEIEVARTC